MKKKITIEVDEQDVTNLNNAFAAYIQILESVRFGLDIPNSFEILRRYSDYDIDCRESEIEQFYRQIKLGLED